MIRSDTKTLSKIGMINKETYELYNSRIFWLKKYHYDGYSTFIFDHFYDYDVDMLIYNYNKIPQYKIHMNNVLMTMQIESKYHKYKYHFICITNFNDIRDMYLYFLEEKNNNYYKILDEKNESHWHLGIKCKNDGFEFYLDAEDVLYFSKSDTLEFLMVYSHIVDRYVYDQYGNPYYEHVKNDALIADRRQGIVATLQYINNTF